MSIDDDRSACSDSWSMQFVSDSEIDSKGELVNQGITANTLYVPMLILAYTFKSFLDTRFTCKPAL